MARKFVVPIGLLASATDPTGHNVGDTYFNTAISAIKIYDGVSWIISYGAVQGTTGSQGTTGTQGLTGLQGLTGSQGTQGITGSFSGTTIDGGTA
jgi:hypothetical protein